MIPRLLALLLFLPCGLIYSQPVQESSLRTFRTFRIFSVTGSFTDFKYEPSPNREAVRLGIGPRPTRTYIAPTGPNLVIYREIPPPPDAPSGTVPTREIVARVDLPPVQARSLVVLAPLPDGKLMAHVLNDDPAHHPAGTLRLVNLSTFPAAVALSHNTYSVDVGSSTVVPYGVGAKLVQMAVQEKGGWTVSYGDEHVGRAHLHAYGFIFNYAPPPKQAPDPTAAPAIFRIFMEQPPQTRSANSG